MHSTTICLSEYTLDLLKNKCERENVKQGVMIGRLFYRYDKSLLNFPPKVSHPSGGPKCCFPGKIRKGFTPFIEKKLLDDIKTEASKHQVSINDLLELILLEQLS